MDAELPVLSVSRLGALVREGLSTLFPDDVWVEGQLSNLRTPRSGHAYFDLIEPSDEPGRPPTAVFSVALWKQARTAIERTLAEAGGPPLVDDLQVRVRVRLDFYPPHGRLQLIMNGIDPTFTMGRLAAERDRLLRQLAEEGLLDRNASLTVPEPALRIGLVTSVGSAAYADFHNELERSGVGFTLLERDTRVQGEGSTADISEGLRVLSSYRPDVIALVRGGGSAADLSVFDAEVVARRIAELPVPVFTGIGHEVDRSVADEVAHSTFKTPTACAVALVGSAVAFRDRIDSLRTAIGENAHRAIQRSEGLRANLADRMVRVAGTTIERHSDLLMAQQSRVVRASSSGVALSGERLDSLAARLRALDPARVLARGWSITRHRDGQLVRSTSGLSTGDGLVTLVADGTVNSTVD
ncbi:MAG: exodeoxyribonuclease VII large subunit [Actinobacteria bacterium]|jgi:exodeoxyribonuclease VII large subunit|nr:exodeoxyribonuclease VII large subunit [Actinomycetota bacterium]MBT3687850.1 exodeoxyribonuclease VII large subunit [Actinomycetota bacterium]MBT4036573.1 exodeoxyribonuclease VII large subunit [Actinomycetota bacterium]MBT4278217.1 exodeoxyribonuclease VII large subunit [Actinomycetota bacterium]MBT4343030.1 exodeoxyribonuclease VII large subunit [Actinomycetota bacterium]